MSSLVKINNKTSAAAIETALVRGDLSQLKTEERIDYYNATCASLGLNPLTRPFEYIDMQGKLVMYARRDCTDQLRKLHRVSVESQPAVREGDMLRARATAFLPDGSKAERDGLVWVGHLKNPTNEKDGTLLANAYMKCETKAARRATLALCGLGMLDETEVEDLRKARTVPANGSKASRLNSRGAPAPAPEPEPVEDAELVKPGDFVCRFGVNFKGKKISEIPAENLRRIVDWIASQPNRTDELAEFAAKAVGFLNETTKGE